MRTMATLDGEQSKRAMRRQAMGLLVALCMPPPSSCFRLITLDLDDTLWPTAPVVAAANAALCSAISARHGVDATPAHVQAAMKRLRPQLEERDGRPATYTQLRASAIADLLGSRPGIEASAAAEKLFEVWLLARHTAAEELLFEGAASALASVRGSFPGAVIAAVTNGRGDPLQMASIARYFDLTVSGEDESVHPGRKPSPIIYRAALTRAGFGPDSVDGWAHVGDDLLNDMMAAKALGARTVLLDPGRVDAGGGGVRGRASEAAAAAADAVESSYTTLDSSEREARNALRAAVPASAVDARIASIADLPQALLALRR